MRRRCGSGSAVARAGLATALAATLLAGCTGFGAPGRSNVADELLRIRGETGLALVSAGPERAVFVVRGERLVVVPPAGYCLDDQSIELAGSAAFALVADCLAMRHTGTARSDGKGEVVSISLPRSFPGILTYSIASDVALKPGDAGLDGFGRALEDPSGRALLLRGNGSAGTRVVERRRIGGAVYVLAEDDGGGASIFAPRFWRAFTMISGRLVMATVSGFSDRPVDENAMLSFLARGMTALHDANGSAADPEEIRLAGNTEPVLPALPLTGTGDGDTDEPDFQAVADPGAGASVRMPLPPVRSPAVRIASAGAAGGVPPAPNPARGPGSIVLPTATVAVAATSWGSARAPATSPAPSVKPR